MRAAIASRTGVRLWHNHPSQDSLSHSDWLCAGVNDDIEVLALNERGSIFVGRIVDWDGRLTALLERLPRLAGDLELRMDSLADELGLAADLRVELAHLIGHVLNRALATCMPVRYAYCLLGRDLAAVAAIEALGILSSGEALAVHAIQRHADDLAAAGEAGETSKVRR